MNKNRKWNLSLWKYLILIVLMISIIFPSMTTAIMTSTPGFNPIKNPVGTDWWPMFRHDATHMGYFTGIAPENMDVLWTYQTDFIISSSPAVSHGRVYVGSWDKNLYCFGMDTGNLLWNYSTNSEITSSPAVYDGKVFIGSQDSYLYCVDAIDGSLLWNFKTGFLVETSPTVVDDKVFFGSSDGSLYCLNTEDGSLVWDYETNSAFVSSPAVFNDKVYVGMVNGNFICLNSITGEPLWVFPTTSGIYSSPTLDTGKVYFGANDHHVYCLDAENGEIIWSYYTGCEMHASPSIAYGLVYIGASDGRMLCLDKENGDFVWSYTINGSVESSPGVADGKLYFETDPCCGFTSYLFCLDAYSGALIWNYNLNTQLHTKSSPALSAGKVFVGAGDGKFYTFGEILYIADANGPYDGFVNTPVQFTGSVYGGEPGYSWSWDLGDGTTSTVQNPSHSYPSVGEYVVTLTITDNLGQIAADDTVVSIDVPNVPPEIPSIDGPTTGKPGEPYIFNITTSDQNNDKVLYYIDWGDNTTSGWIGPYVSGELVSQSHTWLERGSYAVCVKAKDWHGAESDWSTPFNVTIKAPVLTVSFTGGVGITISISNTGDAPATALNWNFTIDKGLILNSYRLAITFTLEPGAVNTETLYVIGLGTSTAFLSAACDEGVFINATIQAKIFLFFVFGIKS
jgi:outer membrane protein assembly factor BamB